MSESEIATILRRLDGLEAKMDLVWDAQRDNHELKIAQARASQARWQLAYRLMEDFCKVAGAAATTWFSGVSGIILAVAVLAAVMGAAGFTAWQLGAGSTQLHVGPE